MMMTSLKKGIFVRSILVVPCISVRLESENAMVRYIFFAIDAQALDFLYKLLRVFSLAREPIDRLCPLTDRFKERTLSGGICSGAVLHNCW